MKMLTPTKKFIKIMEIKYTPCPTPTERPCLMKNEFGEIFLVTDGPDNKIFVTRINEEVETWESNLDGYEPLPKGTKVEIIN